MKDLSSETPDFFGEDALELTSKLLGSDPHLEVLAGEDPLLGVLEVALVVGVPLDQPLHTTALHLALQQRQRLLQVVVADPDPNPPGPLHHRRRRPVRMLRGRRRAVGEGEGGGEAAEEGIHCHRRRSGSRRSEGGNGGFWGSVESFG